jgi:TRAP-type C4-dicarboxylate transport system permease small subunit
MPSDNQRSMPELFTTLVTELTTLFRKEVQLARAEMGEKVAQTAGSVAMIAVGGVLMLAALIILLQAIVTFVTYAGIPIAWAQVIVFVVVALIGFVLLRSGMARMKLSNLVPNRTAGQLSQDATVAKEQVQ